MTVHQWLLDYVEASIERARQDARYRPLFQAALSLTEIVERAHVDELVERFPFLKLEIPVQLTSAQKSELQAVGIDWQNLDWTKIIAILQAIMALFAANQTAMAAAMPKQSN